MPSPTPLMEGILKLCKVVAILIYVHSFLVLVRSSNDFRSEVLNLSPASFISWPNSGGPFRGPLLGAASSCIASATASANQTSSSSLNERNLWGTKHAISNLSPAGGPSQYYRQSVAPRNSAMASSTGSRPAGPRVLRLRYHKSDIASCTRANVQSKS